MGSIPKEAKLAFKGKIFDVYQWEQRMFDGSYQTFEMLDRADTNQIIAIVGDKIMVTKESQPNNANYFSFPGGRLEEDEDPLEGAKRELVEETGYTSTDWELFKTYEPFQKIDWKIHYYIARNCEKTAEPHLDAGEKIEVNLLSFDEYIRFLMSDEYPGEYVLDVLKMKLNGRLDAFRNQLFGTL